jgi:hypothetical protein
MTFCLNQNSPNLRIFRIKNHQLLDWSVNIITIIKTMSYTRHAHIFGFLVIWWASWIKDCGIFLTDSCQLTHPTTEPGIL